MTATPGKQSEALPKRCRISARAEFQRVYAEGQRYDGRLMAAFLRKNEFGYHRLGLTASTKAVGKSVDRNRARRLLRELFRRSGNELGGLQRRYDWVINAKRALLNTLSAHHRRELAGRGIDSEDWFVGALLMGRLSPDDVDDSLRRIHARSAGVRANVSVEILFHPGGAAPGEEAVWARYPELGAYYFSPWHRFESDALRSPEMTACLERWRAIAAPPAPDT